MGRIWTLIAGLALLAGCGASGAPEPQAGAMPDAQARTIGVTAEL